LLGALAGGFAVGRLDRAPTVGPIRFAIELPFGDDLLQQGSGLAMSPDGTRVAFAGSHGGQRGLFLRSFDELEPTLIPGSAEAFAPFFSPDGQWLAFFSLSQGTRRPELTKVKIDGGAPIRITDTSINLAGFTAAGSWSKSGQILFSGSLSTIQRVSASGGSAVEVTALDASRAELSHVQPSWLPGDRALLYVANVGSGRLDIMVASADSGKGRVLVEGGHSPRFAPSGHLLFVRERSLLAASFDLQKLELTGEPIQVVDALGVAVLGAYRSARYDVSQGGTLGYIIDKVSTRSGQLAFVDRQGKATAAFEERGMFLTPRLSPDGGQIAYAAVDGRSGQRNIWIGNLKRGTRTRLTLGADSSNDPIWTPDGQAITYGSTREHGVFSIFTSPADGSGEPIRLPLALDPNRSVFPRIWFRDGGGLVFHAIKTSDDIGIWRKSQATEGDAPRLRRGRNPAQLVARRALYGLRLR
jgi:serine/threonine-protein kinase